MHTKGLCLTLIIPCVFRVNKIEQIDEVEELNLVLGHYAVCWATRGPGGSEGKTDRAREEEKGGADADSWGLIKR